MTMRIDGYKIPVKDISKATSYYRDKLGFTIDFVVEEYGWASINRDGAKLGLYVAGKGGGNRAPGGSIDFSFVITDFEKYHEELKTKGVKISDIQDTDDGMKVFDVFDPDGNEIVIRKG